MPWLCLPTCNLPRPSSFLLPPVRPAAAPDRDSNLAQLLLQQSALVCAFTCRYLTPVIFIMIKTCIACLLALQAPLTMSCSHDRRAVRSWQHLPSWQASHTAHRPRSLSDRAPSYRTVRLPPPPLHLPPPNFQHTPCRQILGRLLSRVYMSSCRFCQDRLMTNTRKLMCSVGFRERPDAGASLVPFEVEPPVEWELVPKL
jgi:hypothetical protein